MTRRARLAALALLGLAVACAGSRAARRPMEPAQRTFDVPEHGPLALQVPGDWTVEETGAEEPLPLAIKVSPPDRAFVLVITPVWDPDAPQEPALAETAQALAEVARRKAREGSVEREIALEELVNDGESVHGYWFTATDRELAARKPKQDEWKHIVRGAAAVDQLLVIFEMLDNGPGPHRDAVLDVVRSARHLPASTPPSPPGPPREGEREGDAEEEAFQADPSIDTVPLSVTVPGQRWSVLVDLPGFRAAAPRPGGDGGSIAVLALNPETGIVASVLLAEAAGARGAAGCRDRDLPKIRKAVPDLRDLRVFDSPGGARVEYLAPTLDGEAVPQWNAHAWRERDGYCVHLHLSKMGHDAGDHALLEAILATLRFGEAL